MRKLLSDKVRNKARIEIFHQMQCMNQIHGLNTVNFRINQAIVFQIEEDLENA